MGGTQFGIPPQQINSLVYTGPELAIVPVVEAQRDPTVNDRQQPIDCFWRNSVTRQLWWLSGFDATGALWVPFTSGAVGPVTMFPVPFGTSPVVPDGLGNVTLTSSSGEVVITGGLNTIDLTLAGTGNITWNVISASQTLVINNGYLCVGGGTLSLALPAVSALGDEIEVALNGSTGWIITQAAGQQIRWSGSTTTLGATGSLASTGTGDSIRLVCQTADTVWVGLGGNGNLTAT